MVLGDPPGGVVDEADPVGAGIRQPAQRIDQRAVGLGIERVHGEVATAGVFLDRRREGDGSATAEGLDIAAEGGDLVRMAVHHQRDGAVVDAGRHRLDAGGPRQRDHPGGLGIGGDVDVAGLQPHHRVAHATADHQRPVPGRGQQAQHLLGARTCQPVAGDLHAIRPASARRIRAVAPQM